MSRERAGVLQCQSDWAVWLVVTAVAAVFLWIAWGGLAAPATPNADLIIAAYRQYVSPKPQERFVVLSLLALVPVCMVGWYRVARTSQRRWAWIPLILAALCVVPWIGGEFSAAILGQYPKLSALGYLWLGAAAALTGWLCTRANLWREGKAGWCFFLPLVALQILSWRVVDINDVTRSHVFTTHMDPVFYALSQVMGGRTLLVDLPSQYGLFPEIVAVFASPIGISIGGISILFAVMQVTSLIALYAVLVRTVRSLAARMLTGASLIVLTYESVLFFVGIDERYYQYWPIRFFWPAISIFVFYWISGAPTLLRIVLFGTLSAIAVLWNFDSGFFVGLAFGAWLFCRAVFAQRKEMLRWLLWLCVHVATVAAIVSLFFLYLSYKSGADVSVSSLFLYQKIFFDLGLMMMPLPAGLNMWLVVVATYVLGLCVALRELSKKNNSAVTGLVLYLSVLGAGLFVYYAGRSHVLNLVTVAWPALVVAAILSDRLLRISTIGHKEKAPAYAFFYAVIVLTGSLAWHVPLLAKSAHVWFQSRGIVQEKFVQDELEMIRKYSAGKEECAILSQRQGIYFAETGLRSSIKGPGIVEALLVDDVSKMAAAVDVGQTCLFLGVGGNSDSGLKFDMNKIYERYRLIAQTPDGSMLYLEKK